MVAGMSLEDANRTLVVDGLGWGLEGADKGGSLRTAVVSGERQLRLYDEYSRGRGVKEAADGGEE